MSKCLRCGAGSEWIQGRVPDEPESPVMRGADALAYQCALLIMRGLLDPRSGVADALLDYLNVGGLDGPKDVPSWVKSYEAQNQPTRP